MFKLTNSTFPLLLLIEPEEKIKKKLKKKVKEKVKEKS